MKVKAQCNIQFMMKSKETDIPKMGNRIDTSFTKSIDVPPELEPYLDAYINDTDFPEIDKVTLKIWRSKVKKNYPEMFENIVMADGSTTRLKPGPKEIIDAAFNMIINDNLIAYMNANIDQIMKDSSIVPPADNDEYYYADKFVHLASWKKISED